MDRCNLGDSIEGLKIEGQSRETIKNRGMELDQKKRTLYRFDAKFNVKAWISEPVRHSTNLINPSSITDRNNFLICDGAVLLSTKNKYKSHAKSNISATHGASCWKFPQQTNVKITKPHLELIQGQQKRISGIE